MSQLAESFFFSTLFYYYPAGLNNDLFVIWSEKHVENKFKTTSYVKAFSLYKDNLHSFPFKDNIWILKQFTFHFLTLLLLGLEGGQDLISMPSSSFCKKVEKWQQLNNILYQSGGKEEAVCGAFFSYFVALKVAS